jgi:AraC family transcriptional regulator of arabinose operon
MLRPGRRELFRFDPRVETHHTWLALRHPSLPLPTQALGALPFALPVSDVLHRILEAALATRGLSLDEPAGRPASPVPPSLAPLVMAALLRYLEEAQACGLASGGARMEPAPVTAAREYLRRHAHKRLTLREVAAAASVSPEHLIRLFKRETGQTPFRHLWQERVRLGVSLLESTGLPVGEVAAQAGFQTVYHFSRMVRATTGLSPTALRRRSWQ